MERIWQEPSKMERMRQEPSKMDRMQQVQSILGKFRRTRINERKQTDRDHGPFKFESIWWILFIVIGLFHQQIWSLWRTLYTN